MISYTRKPNPRAEYRLRRTEEADQSPSLAAKFPKLKALSVTVDYFDATGSTRLGGMKYKLTLDHAKSLFRINCINHDCIGADYDLSTLIAQAIKARRPALEGELRCEGTRRNPDRKQEKTCQCILRYKLALGY
jgi:hypothetical protein